MLGGSGFCFVHGARVFILPVAYRADTGARAARLSKPCVAVAQKPRSGRDYLRLLACQTVDERWDTWSSPTLLIRPASVSAVRSHAGYFQG